MALERFLAHRLTPGQSGRAQAWGSAARA